MKPGFRAGSRLVYDPIRKTPALLYPEGALLLSETAAAVARQCDGRKTIGDIVADLAAEYEGVPVAEVTGLLERLVTDGLLVADGGGPAPEGQCGAGSGGVDEPGPQPIGLVAELTYRCPLRCTYCSNPVELASYRDELGTDEWVRVLAEARGSGVLQVHFSGGEPLLRPDLPELINAARQAGLYSNLVTSGLPLTEKKLSALVEAGLDHLQLSLQDAEAAPADAIAGVRAHDRKLAAAALIGEAGLPLTVNVVVHAGNLDRLDGIAELAVRLGAVRLELAHAQYYGWALRNRPALLPSAEQVAAAAEAVRTIGARFADALQIVYVQPDYHGDQPKPCMNGWGRQQLVVAPNGDILPCLAAAQLPALNAPNARAHSVAEAWYHSDAFNRFRGTRWMSDPCRSCSLREIDFGGCRCQAFQVTGDPAATDPACRFSPHHAEFAALAAGPAIRSSRPVHRSNR